LPLLTQFLSNPAIMEQLALEGKKVDVLELVRSWFEMADLKNMPDMIIDMTPADLQRQQQQSQAALQQSKGAVQGQLEQQRFNNQQALLDQADTNRAARDALRDAWKKAVEPQELTGEPQTSGVGWGGNL